MSSDVDGDSLAALEGAPLDGSSSSVLSLFVLILLCSTCTWYFIFKFLPLVDSYTCTRNLLDILLCDQMDTLIVFNGYILSDFYLMSLNVGIGCSTACCLVVYSTWRVTNPHLHIRSSPSRIALLLC